MCHQKDYFSILILCVSYLPAIVSGHKSPSTTIIYEEPPKEEIEEALRDLD